MITQEPTLPKALSLRRRLVLSLVSLSLLLLVGEIAVRIAKDPFYFGSFRVRRFDMLRRGYPAEPHPLLGFALKPGFASDDNYWGTHVTIGDDGLRSNGRAQRPTGPAIVATGDSFTFGDQVDDTDTWPAQLETLLNRPVHNGGVFAYSFAQAILRAEMLLECIPADWLVVSFIDDDLARCELQHSYTPIPWFEPKDGELVLHPPAPEAPTELSRLTRSVKDTIGYSALADLVLAHTTGNWWNSNLQQHRALAKGQGAQVGLLLAERIASHCRERGVKLLLVFQGQQALPVAVQMLERAKERGAITLDLVAEYETALAADPSLASRWFNGHMTPAGNAWVARRIAAVLADADDAIGTPSTSGRR